jgi:acyl transferase domain-containing protein
LSLKAAQVSEQATDLVPTLGDEWLPSGALLDEARRLLVAAEAVMQRAVTVERESGTSWAEIGRRLGLSEPAVRERFAANSQAWVEGVESLMQPVEGSIEVPLLPGDGVETPDQHAQRLDCWMAERDAEQVDTSRQVSSGLEEAALSEQLYRLSHVARRFVSDHDLRQRTAFHEAEAALLDMAARLHPGDERAARRADESSLTLLALRPTQAKA